MRKEAVAGQFYEGEKKALEQQIKNCFSGKFGAGKIGKLNYRVYGVIAPHAGYDYSGQAASHAYKSIAESSQSSKASQADLFIILGTNHRAIGKNISLSLEDFSTPLGTAKNDNDFAKNLLKNLEKSKIECEINEHAHAYEHSVEVQLPFLQFVLKNKNNKASFVPVIVSHCDAKLAKDIANIIVETSNQLKKKVCIIASSDLAHYGYSYGFMPFEPDKNKIYALDKKATDKIIKFDTKSFLEEAEKSTVCGASAIAVCIETCKLLGAKKAKLLKYYTSGDISDDYSTSVGYAAIAFK